LGIDQRLQVAACKSKIICGIVFCWYIQGEVPEPEMRTTTLFSVILVLNENAVSILSDHAVQLCNFFSKRESLDQAELAGAWRWDNNKQKIVSRVATISELASPPLSSGLH
jgi:hypothetical protein